MGALLRKVLHGRLPAQGNPFSWLALTLRGLHLRREEEELLLHALLTLWTSSFLVCSSVFIIHRICGSPAFETWPYHGPRFLALASWDPASPFCSPVSALIPGRSLRLTSYSLSCLCAKGVAVLWSGPILGFVSCFCFCFFKG